LSVEWYFVLAGEITGAGIASSTECYSKDGYWNMSMVPVNSGVVNMTCTIAGELSLLGITVKGSYTKNQSYLLMWMTMGCTSSSGNCCLANNQGIYIKG
jgi:hypothetical protein